jgi:hypothetical protein
MPACAPSVPTVAKKSSTSVSCSSVVKLSVDPVPGVATTVASNLSPSQLDGAQCHEVVRLPGDFPAQIIPTKKAFEAPAGKGFDQ